MKKDIIPSIIAKSQQELDEAISKVKGFANIIQFDVMDNKFVPNSSFDFDFKLPKLDAVREAHLMMDHPTEWIQNHAEKADVILFHAECKDSIDKTIGLIKEKGKKPGLAINPETDVEKIKPFLGRICEVLVMTVSPGFYGGKFIPEALDKVSQLRRMKPALGIEVDGGINDKTIQQAEKAGANMFVSGSFIVKSKNPGQSFSVLKSLIKPL